jgi:SNF2 family DNA or RNA helicase
MAHVALRRTKNLVKDMIKLVKKTVEVRTISWPEGWHKDVHDALYEAARSVFMSFLMAGSKGESLLLNNYMVFIEVVLRVRQSCCHASLVPEERREAASEILKMAKENGGLLNPEDAEVLLERLRATFQEEPLHECPVCMEEIAQDTAIVLKTCHHIFCQSCLDRVPNQLCPLCRKAYDPKDCIHKSAAEQASKKTKVKRKSGGDRSPKLQALLDAIDQMAPDEKGVIFSQWTSHLNIIQEALLLLGHVGHL